MPGLVAFGTYSKSIGRYIMFMNVLGINANVNTIIVHFKSGLYRDGPLCTFKTGSGVTQIEFSSCGTKLFSAVRRNNEFLCWDLRNPGTVLYSLQGRQSDTNQRIQFNMSFDGKQIVSGMSMSNYKTT